MAHEAIPRKRMPRNDLTAEFVRSILEYDSPTGALRWKINRPPRGIAGRHAGVLRSDGYLYVGIGGKQYMAHRLIHLIMTGDWPPEQVDHENLKRGDLRWDNLRPATHSQNQHNHGIHKNNKSGFKGVYRRKDCNRWCAMITVEGKTLHLGLFKTGEEAACAYRLAAAEFHGRFARVE